MFRLLLPLLFCSVLFSQNHKLVSLPLSGPDAVAKIAALGFDVEHARFDKSTGTLELFVSDRELELLSTNGFTANILIDDWLAHYQSRPAMSSAEKTDQLHQSREQFGVTGFDFGSMGGYYTYAEVIAKLDSMRAQFPNLISQKFSIGTSLENRQIWAVKISDNPDVDEPEPKVLYDALIHAREPQAMATVIYFMYYLLENYPNNQEVRYLVNNREMYFVPVVNPDGYEYNRQTAPNGGGMFRKNRRMIGNTVYGVDLNRNYGYQWGYDNIGSSNDPSSETYRGSAGFSEPETQVIRDFSIQKKFGTYINYHAYNNSIIYPWGYINQQTPDSVRYSEYASHMAGFNLYTYGTSFQTLGYNSNGTARDWMYGEQNTKPKIFGYVFEVGTSTDGFWPAQNRIIPLAQANIKPNIFQAFIAGGYLKLQGYTASEPYIDPGENITMYPAIRNTGTGTLAAGHVTLSYSTTDPYIQIVSAPVLLDSIASQGLVSTSQSQFSIQVSPVAPVDYTVSVAARYTMDNYIYTDTLKFRIGTPAYVFVDTANNPASLWTISGTPGTSPLWESTTASFVSPPNSYTDSRTGNYVNSATVTLLSTGNISLQNVSQPILTFKTRFDFESRYDCGVVEVSTNNGSTWIPLSGRYTKPASGLGKQTPTGSPVYDGVLNTWSEEQISLTPYAGQNIKLRFQLKSDGSQVRDGWYIDDIGIYYYGIVPVELNSFYSEVSGAQLTLYWQTVTETNNRGFAVESSTDKSSWQEEAFIHGRGTSSEPVTYQYAARLPAEKTYYRLKQIDFDGSIAYYGPIEVHSVPVYTFSLSDNYPNPFNPETVIEFSIPAAATVNLAVYDILGNKVSQLVNEPLSAGIHKRTFSAAELASGIYFYRLTSGTQIIVKKLVVTK